jgi:hypothetical protein
VVTVHQHMAAVVTPTATLTAAAIAYGLDKGTKGTGPKNVLVYATAAVYHDPNRGNRA